MLLGLTALLPPSESATLVVASIRKYIAHPAKRPSFHQIYLFRIDGRGEVKQLTHGDRDSICATWVNKDELAWLESEEPEFGFSADGYRIKNVTTKPNFRLIQYSLKSRRAKVVARGTVELSTLYEYPLHFGFINKGQELRFTVSHGRLRKATGPFESSEFEQCPVLNTSFDEEEGKPLANPFVSAGVQCAFERAPALPTYGWYDDSSWDGHSGLMKIGGATIVWPSSHIEKVFVRGGSQTIYAISQERGVNRGPEHWVWKCHLPSGIVQSVVRRVDVTGFDGSRDEWIGFSNWKSFAMLGEKVVCSRDLWAGNLQFGGQWRMTSGVVHTDSAMIRPAN